MRLAAPALFAAALVSAPPIPALAQDEAGVENTVVREVEALDQETLDRAEALFFEGLAHYRAGRYDEAAVSFQNAYVLTQHRDLLFNVARSRERLGDVEGAVEWYRAYLATRPADETAVIHRVRQLGGDPTPKGQEPKPAEPVKRRHRREPRVIEKGAGPWPWVALGVGAAAAGAGAYFGLKALDDADAARASDRRAEASQLKDNAEGNAILADVAFGVGAAAIGAATWLLLSADAEASASPHVGVGATQDGFSLGYSARF